MAWAAGLFEGTGSIVRSGTTLRLMLAMSDEDVVRRYAQVVGTRVLGPYAYPVQADGSLRKPAWKCYVNGLRAELVLTAFWPYLGDRRRARARELGFEPPFS